MQKTICYLFQTSPPPPTVHCRLKPFGLGMVANLFFVSPTKDFKRVWKGLWGAQIIEMKTVTYHADPYWWPFQRVTTLIQPGSGARLNHRVCSVLPWESNQCLNRRRLDIPTGWQTYRAVTVKLILLLSNDQKTKNVIKFYQDFLFQHILIYILLYWAKEDFLKKAHFAPKWLFYQK